MKTTKLTTKLTTTIAVALLTLTAVPAIFAEDAVKTELKTTDTANDGRFIDSAFRAGLAEIKAGEIALEQGTHEGVIAFAKMIVKDHTDVNKNLKAITDEMKLELPKDPGTANQEWLQKIVSAPKASFDSIYIETMVIDHQRIVTLFEDFSTATKNDNLKAFAVRTLPGLRAHLERSLEWKKTLLALK